MELFEVRKAVFFKSKRPPAKIKSLFPSKAPVHSGAIVSSKNQATLPAAMRAKLDIKPGARMQFESHETKRGITPELPVSDCYGTFWVHHFSDIELQKKPDRTF